MEVLKSFADRKGITIPLLSDPGSQVIRQFGILNKSVPKHSPVFGIPHPVTLIVDARGIVQSRHFEADFRRRPTVGSILSESGTASPPVQNPRLTATVSSSDATVRGGERIRLFVRVQLPPRMHVYAPGVSGYIPLAWQMKDNQPIDVLPVSWPPSRVLHLKAIDEKVPVFSGEFTLQRDVVIQLSRQQESELSARKELTIEGSLRVQACDDRQCFVPEDVPLRWTLGFEPHDTERVPAEIRKVK